MEVLRVDVMDNVVVEKTVVLMVQSLGELMVDSMVGMLASSEAGRMEPRWDEL